MEKVDREHILELLPHGRDAVGITSVVSSKPKEIVAKAIVGQSKFMLSESGTLIPEAVLELVGQAAAVGSALSAKERAAGQEVKSSDGARRGVIARVRSLWVDRGEKIHSGEELLVSVIWGESIGNFFELQGEVRSSSNEKLVAKVDCTVLEQM